MRNCVRLLAGLWPVALFFLALPSPVRAQAYLGANLNPFGVLAASAVTCTGPGTISGDLA